jgi:FMN phosphatase YigB (HAD superfamily)
MMFKENIILTDIDGVCLDWEFAFHNWMEVQGHELGEKDVYSMAMAYQMAPEKVKRLIKTFNESAAIGFLPPLRDAQYYIKKLHEKKQYRFVAITSLSLDPYAKLLRERNLKKIFGPNTFKEVICLECGADKDEALKKAAEKYPGAVWIEDKPENANVGASLGFDTYLMEHAHNMNYKGKARVVKNWQELYGLILRGKPVWP